MKGYIVKENRVILTLNLPSVQADALSQLVKRIGWTELRQNARNDEEASDMRSALLALQNELAQQGYDPR